MEWCMHVFLVKYYICDETCTVCYILAVEGSATRLTGLLMYMSAVLSG